MNWNFYEIDLPNYVICEYMTLALAAISIVMSTLFIIMVFKGWSKTYGLKTRLAHRVAYALDDRHIYGTLVHLRVLSLICIPICIWLVSDNYSQWYDYEGGSMWHSSAFSTMNMLPYVIFHIIIVALLIWDRFRPATESYIMKSHANMRGYNAEQAQDAFRFQDQGIHVVK